ncbi:uncharacterized protein [Amphiura filiformis]|uniref:uncharacterized protein n=1 Tax=Amphiura filiformis TaxID=82378 RepID=UPI003B21BC61
MEHAELVQDVNITSLPAQTQDQTQPKTIKQDSNIFSGDIETNPGPTESRTECNNCSRKIQNNHRRSHCSVCSKPLHLKCSGLEKREYRSQNRPVPQGRCTNCLPQMPTNGMTATDASSQSNTTTTQDLQSDYKCSEVDNNDHTKIFDTLKGLRFMCLNINSLNIKVHELSIITYDCKPDILGLNETKLNDYISDNELQISGYDLIRNDRNRNGGGVAAYIRSSLQYSIIDVNVPIEGMWFKVTLPFTRPIMVGIVYRPPDCDQFFELLDSAFQEIHSSNNRNNHAELICLGDFNCNSHAKTSAEKSKWSRLQNTMSNHNMNLITKDPTRITNHSQTYIDHIWTSRPEMYHQNGVIPCFLSDHSIIYAARKAGRVKRDARYIEARSFRRFDETEFLNDLIDVPWQAVSCASCPDLALDIFLGLLRPVCETHAPIKRIKINQNQPNWITNEYLEFRRKCLSARTKAEKSKHPDDWKQARFLRNKLNNMADILKRNYFCNTISSNQNNPRKLWKTIKTLLPGNTESTISSMLDGDNTVSDKMEIASVMNKFFSTIGQKLDDNFGTNTNVLPLPTRTNNCVASFNFNIITEESISKILRSLPTEKATGLDGVNTKFLKAGASALVTPLAHIFNLSLQTGVVPAVWKQSRLSRIAK